MPQHQIKHFGTSGEISTLVEEINRWLAEQEGKLEVVAMSESQGGSVGNTEDPFYFSLNIVYRTL